MKILYSWLQDNIKTTLTPQEIAEALTSIGLEVESLEALETIKGGLQGVVVGEVKTKEQHPNADRLSVCTVDVGLPEYLQIVCGAPNVAVGQRVPVATVNSKLCNIKGEEIVIKRGKIRGVESLGMICAEDELGLGESHEGILVLSSDTTIGQPVAPLFNVEKDYVFEIGLTPNKIDAASHFGVARELKAYIKTQCPEKLVTFTDLNTDGFQVDEHQTPIKIEVEEPTGCPQYYGITIRNVTVKESPQWLQKKLKGIGLRPINNIVDITNYILHQFGQPLHAFDADKIKGNIVKVKTCKEGTKFTTLDVVERTLHGEDLMICNVEEPMCIGGVFGGLTSGVTTETKNIFVESAYFAPTGIRKTAKRHGLNTDASFRYERGTDPAMPIPALKRATMLIKELAGGTNSNIVEVVAKPAIPRTIAINTERICRIIGNDIAQNTIQNILTSLGFTIIATQNQDLKIEVPSYRVEVTQECDVAEEVLRIYGYNNLILPETLQYSISESPKVTLRTISEKIADFLANNNYNEQISLSLSNRKYYEQFSDFDLSNLVALQNPNSADLNIMRNTLIFGGMESIVRNINRQQTSLQLFEIGNVYHKNNVQDTDDVTKLFTEKRIAALFLTAAGEENLWNIQGKTDFFQLKTTVERLLSHFGINLMYLEHQSALPLWYGDGLQYIFNKKPLLTLGKISRQILQYFDIRQDVFVAELHLDTLLRAFKNQKIQYREISKFPTVLRDLSLLVNKSVTFEQLYNLAIKTGSKILRNITLFDVYEGNKLPEGKKSYSLSFLLCDETKTLDNQQIEVTMNKIIEVYDKAGIQIRSGS